MRAIVLAAGYATRMYPLTRDRAKPLLPVGGKPILDYLVENILRVREIEELAVVSNRKFVDSFRDWSEVLESPVPVRVLDDGSTTNENRLGAIGDLRLALDALGTDAPCLVAAGDNFFPFEFQPVVDFFREKEADVITCYPQEDQERLRRTGVATLTDDGTVAGFEEKPPEPRSRWAVPPLYVYTEETLKALPSYLAEGNPPDAPGNFVRWLSQRKPVYAFRCDRGPHDMGTLESYRSVDRHYSPHRSPPPPDPGLQT